MKKAHGTFGKVDAHTEMPGCALCMGNQTRVADGATVVSTSTRNFPNRLGNGANVFLASAELAAICSLLRKIPNVEEYIQYAGQINASAEDTYRYLNFNLMKDYQEN